MKQAGEVRGDETAGFQTKVFEEPKCSTSQLGISPLFSEYFHCKMEEATGPRD